MAKSKWYPDELDWIDEADSYIPDRAAASAAVWRLYDVLGDAAELYWDILQHIPRDAYEHLAGVSDGITDACRRLPAVALLMDPRYRGKALTRKEWAQAVVTIEQEHWREGVAS